MKIHGFEKSERIVSRKLIDELFGGKSSHSLTAFPIRVVYQLITDHKPQASVLISVPKRRFKHAVDRNRVKRQLREAYRLNKQQLLPSIPQGQALLIAFVWLSPDHLPTAQIEQRMASLLQRIAKTL